MRTTLLLAALAAVATCDVSHVLNNQPAKLYGVPTTSYGAPQGSVVGLPAVADVRSFSVVPNINTQYVETPSQVQSTGQLTLPVKEHVSFQSGFSSTPDFGINVYSTPAPQVSFQSDFGLTNANLNLGQYEADAALNSGILGGATISPLVTPNGLGGLNFINRQSSDAAAASQGVEEVQKHLYFFAAPEEEEEPEPRVSIPVAPPKKNVKIIFIKAPTFKAPAPIRIPVQSQVQEKTVVYVLVQKPDRRVPVELEPQVPVTPSKPEVFFIKYKTQKEAEDAIYQAQNAHNQEGNVQIHGVSQEGTPDFRFLARSGLEGQVVSSPIAPSVQSVVTPLAVSVQSTTLGPLAGIGNVQATNVQTGGTEEEELHHPEVEEEVESPTASPVAAVEPSTTPAPIAQVSSDLSNRISVEVNPSDDENVIDAAPRTSTASPSGVSSTPDASYGPPADTYGPPK